MLFRSGSNSGVASWVGSGDVCASQESGNEQWCGRGSEIWSRVRFRVSRVREGEGTSWARLLASMGGGEGDRESWVGRDVAWPVGGEGVSSGWSILGKEERGVGKGKLGWMTGGARVRWSWSARERQRERRWG